VKEDEQYVARTLLSFLIVLRAEMLRTRRVTLPCSGSPTPWMPTRQSRPKAAKRVSVCSWGLFALNALAVLPGDLISTLVGIYGTKEVFVHEFRTLLADK
jgi:hypothetical protein